MTRDFNECFENYTEKFGNSWGMNWRAYMIKRTDKALEICRRFICDDRRKKVIEIGCASGDFSARLIDCCPDNTHFILGDCSQYAVDICANRFMKNSNIETRLMSLPNIDIKGNDFIICMDVLEYFSETEWCECFDNMRECLCDEGIVLIQMPLNGVDKDAFISSFKSKFVIVDSFYVYGQLWYDYIEKWLQPLVQATYINHHRNIFYYFCGWCGYLLLKSKTLVNIFFSINRMLFKDRISHLVITGKPK